MTSETARPSKHPKTLWRIFRPIVVITAELSTILFVAGSLLSIMLNSLIFSRWDINFLSIANTNDVILSGIDIALDIMKIAALGAPFGALGYFGWRSLHTRVNRVAQISVLFAMTISWIAFYLIFDLTFSAGRTEIYPTSALYVGFAFGSIVVGIFSYNLLVARNNIERVMAATIVSIVTITTVLTVIYAFRDGKVDLFVKMDTPIQGCFKPKAVWIGSQSVVARCYIRKGQEFRIGQYIVVDRSDAKLLSPTTWDQQVYSREGLANSADFYSEN